MSSNPNRFISYGEETMNHRGFVPMQMNQNSNHGDLFSPSPSLTCYQNSHISSSSSFGFNTSQINYQMSRNIDYDIVKPFMAPQASSVVSNNFTQISFTETVTKRYSAFVPTNTFSNLQNDFERFKRFKRENMESRTNPWNPRFHPHHEREILNPEPLNVIYPQQNAAYRNHFNMFPTSSRNNQHERRGSNLMRSRELPIRFFDSDSEEDERSYDGRTHSLPCEKYGPYTCPKCEGVFDTSQKFAAHMSNHYKNETNKEREKRYRARNKNKYRKLNQEVHHEAQKIIKREDGESVSVAFKDPVIVKQEPF